ncbi:MAG: hypothetical protein AABX35_04590 [Nanoarchaeota archaeon]
MNNNIRYLEPEIKEFDSFRGKNIVIAIILGCLAISGFILISLLFPFTLVQSILVASSILLVFLLVLLEPQSYREITQKIVETVETPVYREVYVDRPVVTEVPVYRKIYFDKPIIKEVPVIKEVIRKVMVPEYREVIKKVYVERKKKKLNIPKYKFLGSTETKVYHLRSCRFSRLIKRKYKVSNNGKKFFTSKKFKACKICLAKS